MLLQLSISGGILIFFIIILRFFAINKLPKRVFMLLWDITLLRLLMPFNLPLNLGIAFPLIKMADRTTSHMNISGASAMQTDTKGTAMYSIYNIKWIQAIWIIGMIILILSFSILYYKECQKIQTALPIPTKTDESLRALVNVPKRVHIYVSDRIYTPLTCGILLPKIVLPKFLELDNYTELKYVLTHELVHIKKADNLRKIIMLIAASIHWFNPFVWIMYIFFNRDMELACDEKIISLLGQQYKKEYATILVNLAEKQSNWTLFSNGFGNNSIHERIVAIMEFKKISAASIICAVALTGMAITAFAQNKTGAISTSQSLNASADLVDSKYFPEYQKYGLSYDSSGKHLIFEGEIVGYFHDEISKGTYTHITDNAGMIGIKILRDSKYKITGLEKVEVPENEPVYEINNSDSTDQMEELLKSDGQIREYGYPVNTYSYSTSNNIKED